MAEHEKMEYATAEGNDYAEHQRSYDQMVKFAKVGTVSVIVYVIALAAGGLTGTWWITGVSVVLNTIATAIAIFSKEGGVGGMGAVGLLTLVLSAAFG